MIHVISPRVFQILMGKGYPVSTDERGIHIVDGNNKLYKDMYFPVEFTYPKPQENKVSNELRRKFIEQKRK